MKTLRKIFALLIISLLYSCIVQRPLAAQQEYVSLQVFYDQLSPYGQWADNPDYGYVWFPNVGRDFSPYSTNGYWVMTDYGWTWVSGYQWGWAPFHYGRWDYDTNYGWFWVPDYEWGPSWVTWRRADGYYGWSPMRPGVSVNITLGGGYNDINRWNFVHERDFGRRDIYRYYSSRSNNYIIIRNSRVINNIYNDRNRNATYYAGPQRDDVQRVTGRSIRNVTVQDYDRPGEKLNNNRLNIYRPRVERINNQSHKPVPSGTINMRNVRPAEERNPAYQPNKIKPVQNNRRVEQHTQQQQIQKSNGQQQRIEQKQELQKQQKQGKTERQKQAQKNKQQDKKNVNKSENRRKSKQQITTPPPEKKKRSNSYQKHVNA